MTIRRQNEVHLLSGELSFVLYLPAYLNKKSIILFRVAALLLFVVLMNSSYYVRHERFALSCAHKETTAHRPTQFSSGENNSSVIAVIKDIKSRVRLINDLGYCSSVVSVSIHRHNYSESVNYFRSSSFLLSISGYAYSLRGPPAITS